MFAGHFVLANSVAGARLRGDQSAAAAVKNTPLPALLLATVWLALQPAPVAAQLPANAATQVYQALAERGPVFAAAAIKLFGSFTNFTADADLRVTDRGGAEVFTGPVTYALSGYKARVDADASKATSAKLSAATLAQLQALGAVQVAAIARADQLKGYALLPVLSAYAQVAIPANIAAAALAGTNATLVKTPLGTETIGGHPTVKHQTTVTTPTGQVVSALVWNATDLQNFPIQIQYADSQGTVTATFKQVSLVTPASSLFDVPAGYTLYTPATVPADLKAAAKDALKKALGR